MLFISTTMVAIECWVVSTALWRDTTGVVCDQPLVGWLWLFLAGDLVQFVFNIVQFCLARSTRPLGMVWGVCRCVLFLWFFAQVAMTVSAHWWLGEVGGPNACSMVNPPIYTAVRSIIWLFYFSIALGIAIFVWKVWNGVVAELGKKATLDNTQKNLEHSD